MTDQAEVEAWDEYLESCRLADVERYDVVEVWAWDRLNARLCDLVARKKKKPKKNQSPV